MIQIRALKTGESYFLKIRGHANHKKDGDIVCAAVSSLYFALLSFLETDDGVIKLQSREEEGLGKLSFTGRGHSHGAFKMAIEGFTLLQRNFPKNVKVIFKERV